MEFFITKIFQGKIDNDVHLQFQKFSRGTFDNKALLKIKNQNKNFLIESSSEYVREFLKYFGEKLGKNKTYVKGAIISAVELEGKIKYEEKKNVIGVKKYIIDREMSGDEILDLCEKIPKAFLGLSFKVGDEEIKIKDKPPKSTKGIVSEKEGNLKIDICKIKTKDKELIKKLVFDEECKDLKFKVLTIKHNFIISDIIIPDYLKNEKDYEKIRENALRKGKIIRILDIDGKVISKEKDFQA